MVWQQVVLCEAYVAILKPGDCRKRIRKRSNAMTVSKTEIRDTIIFLSPLIYLLAPSWSDRLSPYVRDESFAPEPQLCPYHVATFCPCGDSYSAPSCR
jgi:hypothetical protein